MKRDRRGKMRWWKGDKAMERAMEENRRARARDARARARGEDPNKIPSHEELRAELKAKNAATHAKLMSARRARRTRKEKLEKGKK